MSGKKSEPGALGALMMGALGIAAGYYFYTAPRLKQLERKRDLADFQKAYPDDPGAEADVELKARPNVWLKARSTLRQKLRPKLDALSAAQAHYLRESPKDRARIATLIQERMGWAPIHSAMAALGLERHADGGFAEKLFADDPTRSPLPTRKALRKVFAGAAWKPQPKPKPESERGKLQCSFCGKNQSEVRKLIAGPSVYICDECVSLCDDIIAQEKGEGLA